jgi:hypothetical protein
MFEKPQTAQVVRVKIAPQALGIDGDGSSRGASRPVGSRSVDAAQHGATTRPQSRCEVQVTEASVALTRFLFS